MHWHLQCHLQPGQEQDMLWENSLESWSLIFLIKKLICKTGKSLDKSEELRSMSIYATFQTGTWFLEMLLSHGTATLISHGCWSPKALLEEHLQSSPSSGCYTNRPYTQRGEIKHLQAFLVSGHLTLPEAKRFQPVPHRCSFWIKSASSTPLNQKDVLSNADLHKHEDLNLL